MINRKILLAVLAVSVAAPLAAQKKKNVKHTDVLTEKSGKQIRKIQILSLDLDVVKYTRKGKEREIPTSKIADARLGELPEAFVRARSMANLGNYAKAAELFVDANAKADRDVVKLTATFRAGRCFALAAAKDPMQASKATQQLESYVASAAKGYYLPEAQVRLAQSRLASGDASGAERTLTTLKDTVSAAGWPLRWVANLHFSLAKAQLAQAKFTEARSSFNEVDSAVSAAMGEDNRFNAELENLRTDALVMQGETFIGQNMFDDALNYYRQLGNGAAKGVKAAAQAGQGQILFLQGSEGKDDRKLRQAQIALARASVEPDTNQTTAAKTLYYMGMVLNALGDDKEARASARAKTYFQSVKINFAATSWAALARKELGG